MALLDCSHAAHLYDHSPSGDGLGLLTDADEGVHAGVTEDMELVLFIGIQATGKSSFYRERFFGTHVRVNLDMLKTRRRESLLVAACLEGKTSFVVDNTNVTCEDRARYIPAAKANGFTIRGYFFQSRVVDALARNAKREGKARVPDIAIHGARGRLELPAMAEGFDSLQFVQLAGCNQFTVEEWKNEV